MKNKYVFAILILFCSPLALLANDSLSVEQSFWKRFNKGGYTSLLFNQITFMNWAKGGENAVSATGLLNLFANQKSGRFLWENIADFKYGLQISDENGFRTNQDVIDLSSKFGYQALKHFFYSALINFKTQFTPGYSYPNDSVVVSNFLAPGYLILSLGVDFKVNDNLSIYLSPMTGKYIIVNDEKIADAGRYTGEGAIYDSENKKIKSGNSFKSDFGAYVKIIYKTELMENTTLNTKLEVFNNFTDKNIKNRNNFDIDSETTVIMKVNEFISANLFLQFIYDDDIKVPLYASVNGVKTQIGAGPRLQLKEVIGVGLSYNFK